MTKLTLALLGIVLSAAINTQARAEECRTQRYPDGTYSTECSSEVPSVTLPTSEPLSSGNDCQYSYNGVCDDPQYTNSISARCLANTDNFDCEQSEVR
jgi:hypothetical protein